MVRNALLVAALILCSAPAVMAADLNGQWAGVIASSQGDLNVVFTFTVDGTKLTGSSESALGTLSLQNGTVNGDKYSFDIDIDGQLFSHKGSISGDTITMQIEGIPDTLTFTRVVPAGIDGTWRGTMHMEEHGTSNRDIVYVFKTDGKTVTGFAKQVIGNMSSSEMPISNGTVNGNTFSFNIDSGYDVLVHHCTLSNDIITVIMGPPEGADSITFTLARVKE